MIRLITLIHLIFKQNKFCLKFG